MSEGQAGYIDIQDEVKCVLVTLHMQDEVLCHHLRRIWAEHFYIILNFSTFFDFLKHFLFFILRFYSFFTF